MTKQRHHTPDDLKPLLNHTYEEAEEAAKKAGYQIRKSCVDGVYMVVTRDYRLDRINVTLVNNIVTEAFLG